ncbi:hypothetical protein B0H19DRAFT_1082614 [Mycena capillaripes]|nr:hypothetical protein B0H19DRAFT_1082614 [Mycena capillaripes]
MTYAFAVTRLVNPPGIEPIFTEEQFWKGLEFRMRNPAGFRPVSSSRTISDEGNKLVQEITVFNEVLMENFEIHPQIITYLESDAREHAYSELTIDSKLDHRVTNLLSYGPADELLLTFLISFGIVSSRIPDDEPKPSAKELNKLLGEYADRTIVILRQMVVEGKV